ncbi:MAG TPA: hypothetical protein VII22_28290 [Streptosporangiaceae bacterium]
MNADQDRVAALELDWPAWQIWVVPRVVGGTVWCARRWDGTGDVLNAGSADELTEHLVAATTAGPLPGDLDRFKDGTAQ